MQAEHAKLASLTRSLVPSWVETLGDRLAKTEDELKSERKLKKWKRKTSDRVEAGLEQCETDTATPRQMLEANRRMASACYRMRLDTSTAMSVVFCLRRPEGPDWTREIGGGDGGVARVVKKVRTHMKHVEHRGWSLVDQLQSCLEACVTHSPGHSMAKAELANIHMQRRRWAPALTLRMELVADKPWNAEYLLGAAIAAHLAEAHETAAACMEVLQRQHPTPSVPNLAWTKTWRSSELIHFHALVLQAAGRCNEALQMIRKHPCASSDECVMRLTADLCTQCGEEQHSEAAHIYRTLVARHPSNLNYHRTLVSSFLRVSESSVKHLYESLLRDMGVSSEIDLEQCTCSPHLSMTGSCMLRAILEILSGAEFAKFAEPFVRQRLALGMTAEALWGNLKPLCGDTTKAHSLLAILRQLADEETDVPIAEVTHRKILLAWMLVDHVRDSNAGFVVASAAMESDTAGSGTASNWTIIDRDPDLTREYIHLCLAAGKCEDALGQAEMLTMAQAWHTHGTRRSSKRPRGSREDNVMITQCRLQSGKLTEAEQNVVLLDEDGYDIKDPEVTQVVWYEAGLGTALLTQRDYERGYDTLAPLDWQAHNARSSIYEYHAQVLRQGSIIQYLEAVRLPHGIDPAHHLSAARAIVHCCIEHGHHEAELSADTKPKAGFLLSPRATCVHWAQLVEDWMPRDPRASLVAGEGYAYARYWVLALRALRRALTGTRGIDSVECGGDLQFEVLASLRRVVEDCAADSEASDVVKAVVAEEGAAHST